MGYYIVIIVSAYLLVFQPLERFLLFVSLCLIAEIISSALKDYKRVKTAHKPAFKQAMKKFFLFSFGMSAVPLVFVVAYLVSFVLQKDPHQPLIGYMSSAVAILVIFFHRHFISPRIPPRIISDKEMEEMKEFIHKLPPNNIQVKETQDGRYLIIRPPKEGLPLTKRALFIFILVMVTLDMFIWFIPELVGWFILVNLFLAGHIMGKILPPYKEDKKRPFVLPLIIKAFLVTLPFTFGLGILIFKQGTSLLASSLIAFCVQLFILLITHMVEPYQRPSLQSTHSSDLE